MRSGVFPAVAVALAIGSLQLTACGGTDTPAAKPPSALELATSQRNGAPFEETVTITKSGFRPRKARVLVGGSITWINVDPDGPHTAETTDPTYKDLPGGQDGSFDSHTLSWEEPYTVTFHYPGAFEYGSSFDSWQGTVEVVQRGPLK